MKNVISFLFLVPILAFSQADLSPQVQETLYGADRSEKNIEVWIQFSNQLNFEELAIEFEKQNLTNHQRRNRVYKLLHENHAKSKDWLIDYLYVNAPEAVISNLYWLSNTVVVSLNTSSLKELASQKQLKWVEMSTERMILMESQKNEHFEIDSEKESINGRESGLSAINAPAMWKRGYTGLGKLALIMDTGIWEEHPALGGRWKGRRASLSSTWYGYDSPVPKDKGIDHGTHVTGTVLGLDRSTNDTIGVAFNAQFINSDFVAGNINEIKPLHIITPAFQWAFNPDGDTSTYDDVPDVLNNSWGHGFDTLEYVCTNPIGDAIAALQLSGTAVVWGAGNNGPGNKTIGSPATITRNPYLVFTVGAVNGNIASYPIASFSSRGPSHCVDTGKLAIKPEVVAPGVNVRSSIGQNGYANYSGTSMAGPHVVGAVLLLKEAFPTLAGEKILEALYITAHDLGVAGEDNIYGNGMIDVDSAFVWLSKTHTPVPAKKNSHDIVLEFSGFKNNLLTCDQDNEANLLVINTGNKTLSSLDLKIVVESYGGKSKTLTLSKNLLAGDTTFIKTPITYNPNGQSGFIAKLALNAGYDDALWNNTIVGRWNNIQNESLPYFENFENGYGKWIVQNPDKDYTWALRSIGDSSKEEKSLQLSFYYIRDRNAQKDVLISPKFNASRSSKLEFTFDYAYTTKAENVFVDTLKIYATSDCNLNKWKLISQLANSDLITAPIQGTYFVPTQNEWKTKTVDLSAFDGYENLTVKMEGINDFGNNLYLDNFIISGKNFATVGESVLKSNISIFPNPTHNELTISGDLGNFQSFEIHSSVGRLVQMGDLKNQNSETIHWVDLSAGSYFLVLRGKEVRYFPLIIN